MHKNEEYFTVVHTCQFSNHYKLTKCAEINNFQIVQGHYKHIA